jgi:hypothetical protein
VSPPVGLILEHGINGGIGTAFVRVIVMQLHNASGWLNVVENSKNVQTFRLDVKRQKQARRTCFEMNAESLRREEKRETSRYNCLTIQILQAK